MSDLNTEFIISVWDTIKDYLIVKEKKEASYFFAKLLEEWGVDLDEILGQDDILDYGINKLILEENEKEEEEAYDD